MTTAFSFSEDGAIQKRLPECKGFKTPLHHRVNGEKTQDIEEGRDTLKVAVNFHVRVVLFT